MNKYFADQPIQIEIPTTSLEVPSVGDVLSVKYSISKVAPTTGAILTDVSLNPASDSNLVLLDLSATPVTESTVFQVSYTLSTATNDYTYTFNFMVSPGDTLVVGGNSYQNYPTALLTAEELSGVDSFKMADKAGQQSAMVHAYNVLNTLVYVDRHGEYYDLSTLDEDALLTLEPGFLKALKIAQVIEANEMLDPNSIYTKRQDGLMSETIGESSMMFRPGNINNYPVTRRSLMFLRNYILIRAKLERG